MDMPHLSGFQENSGVEESVIGGLLHQAYHDGNIGAQRLEPIQMRTLDGKGQGGNQVLDEIPGEAQFGKDDDIDALLAGAFHHLLVEG
jgi:hypothetical protein